MIKPILALDKEINKIVEMKTLENLNMLRTNISALTERFEQLKNLKELTLQGCPAGRNMPPTLRAQLESQGCTISG